MLKVNSLHFKKMNKFKNKKEKTKKKSYVACNENEISSFSDEDHASKVLMTSHHSSDEEHEVSDSEVDDRLLIG